MQFIKLKIISLYIKFNLTTDNFQLFTLSFFVWKVKRDHFYDRFDQTLKKLVPPDLTQDQTSHNAEDTMPGA